jgi:hypothetical protein
MRTDKPTESSCPITSGSNVDHDDCCCWYQNIHKEERANDFVQEDKEQSRFDQPIKGKSMVVAQILESSERVPHWGGCVPLFVLLLFVLTFGLFDRLCTF